jgi:geranylgeranylglycerol-phosphate geranylgeranyltransferase
MFTQKIKGMIRLFRPELPLAAGVCVLAGQVLTTGTLPPLRTGLLGFICIFAISGSALVLNDYFDFEVDKINAPQRPLPSGAVSRVEALGLTVLATIIGLASAFALGLNALLISVFLWIIGFLYNWRFKQSGLPGNLMVSTSVALSFIFGAATMNEPWNKIVWVFSLMAFLLDLGEEIAGDAMDMEGDKKRNSRSIALLKGKAFALHISLILWGVMICLSFLPVIMGWLGISYLIIILLTDAMFVFFSVKLVKAQTPEAGRKAMRGIYLGATVFVIAFLVGQLIK